MFGIRPNFWWLVSLLEQSFVFRGDRITQKNHALFGELLLQVLRAISLSEAVYKKVMSGFDITNSHLEEIWNEFI